MSAAGPVVAERGAPRLRGESGTLTAFVVAVLFGGGNAIAIRVSNRELPPLWGASWRFGLTAVLFVGLMLVLRLPLPRGRALAGSLLYGALNFGISSAFAYYSLLRLHAGLGQTLVAVIPLMTLLLAVLYGQERLRGSAVMGSALAVVGIAVMSGASLSQDVPILSVLSAMGAALTFAQSTIVARALPAVQPVVMNAVGATAGAVFLILAALITGEPFFLPHHSETWLAVGYLVPLGTALVFGLYVLVLRSWAASRVAYAFVLMPVVTVVLSAWLDREPIGAGLLAGGLLVIGGVYIGALRRVASAPSV